MPTIPNVVPGWGAFRVDDDPNGGEGGGGGNGGGGGGSKLGEWSSLIGIITAIVGNILIALALNVQRYSHIKLHKQKVEARERAKEAMRRVQAGDRNGYGTTDTNSGPAQTNGHGEDEADQIPETRPLTQSFQSGESGLTEDSADDNETSSTYLKSPSWWLGQVLMTIGEMGNFLAYGFAPASIVSPLGVVALISNCVIAPIFFGEIFRKRDFWGVVVATAGAVVVVLSAKQEETKLDPGHVWKAITTMEFEVYMAVSVTLIVVLMWASPKYGNRTILIDLGLVGLFGAYTALSTKGVSSMLSSTLWRAFATPVTYALIFVLLGTAIMQVRYVNKALQRFDSTQVIPIQFVMFTLSVIIGSAVLYRDFERTSTEQALKFIGGCLLTFFGVFLVTSGRPRHDDEESLSDDEGIEETIGLRDQETGDAHAQGAKPGEDPAQSGSSRSSRRSSRVSFAIRPPATQRDSGVPSLRRPDASTSRGSLLSRGSPGESSPLLASPWENQAAAHPGLPSAFSEDSVATMQSVTTVNSEPPLTDTHLPPHLLAPPSPSQRPTTPRSSFSSSRPHSHHYSNTFISPSPLSSTVNAMVADALSRGEDSPLGKRRSTRRLRQGIRSSLFVPQDEEEEGHEVEALLQATATEPGPGEPQGPAAQQESGSGRGRAKSFSNTLGEFFGRKKRNMRRNTNPERDLSQASQSSGGLAEGSESRSSGGVEAPPP